MKKLVIGLFVLAIAAVVLAFLLNFTERRSLYMPERFESAPPYQPSPAQKEISDINARTARIAGFSSRLQVKVYRRLTFHLTGDLDYQKPKNSYISLDSKRGREFEVGSNAAEFWFYSRRMDPPALYYAKHEDLFKTRLKAPFHPAWIMQGLTLEKLVFPANARYEDYKGDLRVVCEEPGPNNQVVRRVVLIDTKSHVPKGNYLYSSGNEIIASVEINEFQQVGGFPVPKSARIVWVEGGERLVMDWEFVGTSVNAGPRVPGAFTRPTRYTPQIDMAKD